MKRRDFLKIATGSAGGAAAVGAAGAQSSPSSSAVLQQEGNNSTDNGTTTGNGTEGNGTTTSEGGGGGGGGTTKTVTVGPDDQNVFDPETVYVAPGDTVEWIWDGTVAHNVHATDVPDEADWDVQTDVVSAPNEYSYTFEDEPTGEYQYVCDPHASVGMEGTVVVNESGQPPAGEGGGGGERTPHEMGVPFQAHFVGIATILMMIVSLVYTFFALKYGESRHASAPNKE